MPSLDRALRLRSAYTARLAALRAEVDRRVKAAYSIDIDAIDASFARFTAAIEPTLVAGQGSIAALAAAFLNALSLEQTGRALPEDDADIAAIAGTTREGRPLLEGMAAFGPMVLARIGAGGTTDEALDFGRYLATRFADNELTGAVDRVTERRQRHAVAWEGVVQPGSCDRCQRNAGQHELDVPVYRHPGCGCDRIPVFG